MNIYMWNFSNHPAQNSPQNAVFFSENVLCLSLWSEQEKSGIILNASKLTPFMKCLINLNTTHFHPDLLMKREIEYLFGGLSVSPLTKQCWELLCTHCCVKLWGKKNRKSAPSVPFYKRTTFILPIFQLFFIRNRLFIFDIKITPVFQFVTRIKTNILDRGA